MCGVPFKYRKESSRASMAPVSNANGRRWAIHPAIAGRSFARKSSRTYRYPTPGPPQSHLSTPPTAKSAPRLRTSIGITPAAWKRSRMTYAPTRCAFYNRLRIHDVRAAEEHLGNRHEQGTFIDGGKKLVEIDAHWIVAGNEFNAGAVAPLLVIEILNRRKFQVRHHHFVPRTAKVKTRADDRLNERDVLMQRNFARPRSDQRSDLVAHVYGHFPPALFPGAHAPFTPRIRVGLHFVVHAARHGAQRIADHVRRTFKDRKFAAPLQKFIHLAELHRNSFGNGPFSRQGSTAK